MVSFARFKVPSIFVQNRLEDFLHAQVLLLKETYIKSEDIMKLLALKL